uniref:Putative DNA-directed RNA polymerase I subunit rpa49 n=1 Tax=Davidia involucrata TaxID=16924 RepID=A0A5B6YW05_DAVIN
MRKEEEEEEEYDEKPEVEVEVEEEEEENKKKKRKKKKNREKIEVKVETLSEHPDKVSPLVGYFPSGFDPLKVDPTILKSEEEEEIRKLPRVRVFRHETRNNRLQLVVSPNGSQVDFVGTNYSGEAAAAQVCTYALGVLDKQTQTLKIVPIASNKIFRLEPRVGGSDLSENEPSNTLKEELSTENKADKVRDLTLMYSTKKSINKAKKLESLHQKEDAKYKEELDRKIKRIKINNEALGSGGTYNARNIPPHDTSATTPQMAYPLDKIIFSGEWDYLLDILELSQVGAEVALDVFPSFVCNRVNKLEDIEDEMEKQQLACILSYITHLIKFKDKHSMDGASSAKYHKIPSILFQKFSAMFADSDSKRLLDEKNDLLLSYILVLTLFVDGFRSDPSDIARDLRMTAITLRPHYEYLGCKLVRKGQLLLATLPVPLQFPTLRKKRRK